MNKQKLFLIIFAIILLSAVGIISFRNIRNDINIQSSKSSQVVSGIESDLYSSFAVSSSKISSEQTAIPDGWNDGGIFSAYYSKAYQKLSTMSLEEKVGQLFLGRCPETNAVISIKDYQPSGFVLFGEDFKGKSSDAVVSAIKSYQNASSIPMLMAVDEEGGTIVRISSNPLLAKKKFLSPHDIYEVNGLNAIRSDTLEKAVLLKKLGLNVNLAPVADVSQNPSDYMYERTLGKPAEETGNYVSTVVKAMDDSGLSSTLKHFPGYGNNADTHTGIAVDNRPYSTFENSDFIPFQDGIKVGAESILVSHNMVTCMDKGVPTSLSPAVHDILRNTLHFTGVIMTDDLSMDAINDYTQNQKPAVVALLAGNDLLMMSDFEDGYNAVIEAVKSGVIPQVMVDKAVFRVLAWKYAKGIL